KTINSGTFLNPGNMPQSDEDTGREREFAERYVHKIAPSDKDRAKPVWIRDNAFSNRNTLGKALRDAGILSTGGRIVDFRVEGDKVVAFPAVPGLTTYRHSIVLTYLG